MGTLLNRRRYMGGVAAPPYDENSYIQNGLVFQLDGINKGSNQGKWTDLVGGIEFTIPESEYLTKETNGFTWTGGVNMPPSSQIPQGGDYTVEIAMIRIGTGDKWGVFSSTVGNGEGTICIGRWRTYFQVLNRKRNMPNGNVPSDVFVTVSMSSEKACVNGIEKNLNSGTDYMTTVATGVGKVYSSGCMLGTIYAIRIYNRQLTVAEMQENQTVDLARFGT